MTALNPQDVSEYEQKIKTGRLLKLYRKLHDGLSDMVEDSRLTDMDIPDDYQWLVDLLAEIATQDPAFESDAEGK